MSRRGRSQSRADEKPIHQKAREHVAGDRVVAAPLRQRSARDCDGEEAVRPCPEKHKFLDRLDESKRRDPRRPRLERADRLAPDPPALPLSRARHRPVGPISRLPGALARLMLRTRLTAGDGPGAGLWGELTGALHDRPTGERGHAGCPRYSSIPVAIFSGGGIWGTCLQLANERADRGATL